MKEPQRIDAQVTDFERATGYCALYLAWSILDETCNYLRMPLPETYANKLAHRAKVVFDRHPF
jgi:hypothetical protein